MASYSAIWTTIGLAKRATALAGGARVEMTHLALAETDGGDPGPPDPDTTTFGAAEVWRGELNTVEVSDPVGAPSVVTIETTVPAEDGPFAAGAFAIVDADGDFVAIGSMPYATKPDPSTGAASAWYVRTTLDVVNVDLAVELILDPAVVMASREYVQRALDASDHYAWMTWR